MEKNLLTNMEDDLCCWGNQKECMKCFLWQNFFMLNAIRNVHTHSQPQHVISLHIQAWSHVLVFSRLLVTIHTTIYVGANDISFTSITYNYFFQVCFELINITNQFVKTNHFNSNLKSCNLKLQSKWFCKVIILKNYATTKFMILNLWKEKNYYFHFTK